MKQIKYSVETIPADLIIEILSRLPAKLILSFRSVSKLWDSIIVSPYFAESFMKRSCARPKILFTCEKNGSLIFFTSPQTQNSSPVVGVDRLSQFQLKGYYYTNISGSVSGLVYCEDHQVIKGKNTIKRVIGNLVLGNPSTGQSLLLPQVKRGRRSGVNSFFGYDPIEKQFKVLSMTSKIIDRVGILEHNQVLTLGSQKPSWRMIQCLLLCHDHPSNGVCINGCLYYHAQLFGHPRKRVIACFDVRFEKFTFINIAGDMVFWRCTLVNYKGKLGVLSSGRGNTITKENKCFKLWVLVDAEKHEWLKHVYVLPPLWKDLVTGTTLVFVGVTGTTNEIVLAPPYCGSDPFYIFYYNMERETIRRVEIQGMNECKGYNVRTSLDHVDDFRLMQLFRT